MKWVFTICFWLLPIIFFAEGKQSLYLLYEKLYENFNENNAKALPFVAESIKKAKEIKDFKHLSFAYEDAVYFASDADTKLKFADSAILAANKTLDVDLISRAVLGKGIVYYFNFKNYSKALAQYLIAFKTAENSKDNYLKYKIIYHLGAVKNYLGYYNEAIKHFKDCHSFFSHHLQDSLPPNKKFNYTRGLLNSSHQLITAYQYLQNHKAADSVLALHLPFQNIPNDFDQEKGYLWKGQGISKFQKAKYREAEKSLHESIKLLWQKKDFAAISVAHYYLGCIKIKENNRQEAFSYFKKVDSSFILNNFIIPEVRATYIQLVKMGKEENNEKELLYNLNQLVKVDKILLKDFPYLSSRLHQEYDHALLEKDKKHLKEINKKQMLWLGTGSILSLAIIGFLTVRNVRQKRLSRNYEIILEKLKNNDSVISTIEVPTTRKQLYDKEIVEELLIKLKGFEENHKFLQKGLTITKLASSFKTNATHLSYVVNEYKGMNFNTYLKKLRINYITQQLYLQPKLLNYTVESLAQECGISSRQVLSEQFYEINGIRPTDFIKKRLLELKNNAAENIPDSNTN